MPAIRTRRGFVVWKLVLLGLQGCVTTTAASRFSCPLLPFFPGERYLSPAASPLRLCSVSQGLCWSLVSGRRGAQLPTQLLNLRPPPSRPDHPSSVWATCHLQGTPVQEAPDPAGPHHGAHTAELCHQWVHLEDVERGLFCYGLPTSSFGLLVLRR